MFFQESKPPLIEKIGEKGGFPWLGRDIGLSSGRLFQNRKIVSVGQSEVDNLQVVAVVGNDNVLWLEVTMHNLL